MPCYALADAAPDLAPDSWVAPSADLIGAVRLGAGASIWFGAVVRADNGAIVIGAGSNVQDGAVLHSDPGAPLALGQDCTVGHRAVLHGCTIGDRVLIGMGATVLNHAVIAEDCIVGAGALVTEGKAFPPRSLIVGAPARAVRTLTDEQLAGLRLSAAVYVDKARRYREGLREGWITRPLSSGVVHSAPDDLAAALVGPAVSTVPTRRPVAGDRRC